MSRPFIKVACFNNGIYLFKEAKGSKEVLSILIVDDEVITRDTLKLILQKSFFSPIYTAADAKSTLHIIRKNPVDIILMDIKLPDKSGLDLMQTIRAITPHTEFIVITGYGSQDVAIQSLRKGAIDYIEKPIEMEGLLAAIGRAEEKLYEQKKKGLSDKNTILIVDKEAITTNLLKEELVKSGYTVFTANTGREAESLLTAHKIEILITNLTMQDESGIGIYQLSKKIQRDIEGIVIAGVDEHDLMLQALRAGAYDFILKPVHFDLLLLKIEKVFEKIKLYKKSIYRSREIKITSEIVTKVNEELERRIEERSQELSKTQVQLFQTSKLATLGEMSAGLAHELNQPLGAMTLTIKYLKRLLDIDQLSQEILLKAIQDIDSSIKRMTSVIQHIRTFARQDTLKFEEVNINETVDAALNLLGEQLRLHEINVSKTLSPGLPPIAGEPFQLEQVWLNLLSNSRDAIEEKARWLKQEKFNSETIYKKQMHISTMYENGKVVFMINDNGIGMHEEVKNKIFEPFFSTKEVGQALGLGMAISYGIVESHKGRIEVESKEGEGTVIKVLFDPFKE